MKLPLSPPSIVSVLAKNPGFFKDLSSMFSGGPDVDGKYEHWDHLRHLTPPTGMTSVSAHGGFHIMIAVASSPSERCVSRTRVPS